MTKNTKPNLLFVCAGNIQRSKSFEHWFIKNRSDKYNIRSAGINHGYPYQINHKQIDDTLEWANYVYVMDITQEMFIAKRFPEYMGKVTTIGISDQYEPDCEEIIEAIEYWTKKYQL